MKKKISIILILICLILVGGLLIFRNDKENIGTKNNQITSENEIQYQDNEDDIIENIVIEEKDETLENNKIKDVKVIEEETEKKDNPKENKQNNSETNNTTNKVVKKENTTTNKPIIPENNKEEIISKNEEEKETISTEKEKPKENVVKENEKSTTEKPAEDKPIIDNTKTEEKQENQVKCTHSASIYYTTKAEAIAEYDRIINEWSDKWLNNEVDDETYYKNCPDGYEIFSCPYCNKWTISLYY